ncbi:hypothetical protein [uncultured Fibrobacter sp.]|uniref:hypothetical protein n=1 Tax=uncultured Fibrobacter sp. TaxID=261512 RepID=UPI0028038588|nr:hypothetical protein [uncultured Fibrobacter sp.]
MTKQSFLIAKIAISLSLLAMTKKGGILAMARLIVLDNEEVHYTFSDKAVNFAGKVITFPDFPWESS